MTVLSLGIVRGLAGQVIGTALGIVAAVIVRIEMGLSVEVKEGAIIVGILVGAVGFLIGAGVFTDWFKWMLGIDTPLHHGPPEGKPAWTRYFGVDYSHKIIGIQYGVTAVALLFLAGMLALTFRVELTNSGLQLLDNHTYNTIMSTHGIVMIAAMLVGLGAMANYLTPLMIGASDMVFPRLNAFAFWINVPAAIIVAASMYVGGWDTGWTAYAPLSINAPLGMQFVLLGVFMIGLSSIMGSINVIVTVLHKRSPGMTLFRMPIFVWSVLATSIIALTATQLIGLAFLMVSAERALGMTFFSPILTPGAVSRWIASGSGSVVSESILVLLASGSVRFHSARVRHHQRTAAGFCPQTTLRLQVGSAIEHGYRIDGFPGLGASYVYLRDVRGPANSLYGHHNADCSTYRRQVLQLGRNVVGRQDQPPDADALCDGRHLHLSDWRTHRAAQWSGRDGSLPA